jgi:hypothetical protein
MSNNTETYLDSLDEQIANATNECESASSYADNCKLAAIEAEDHADNAYSALSDMESDMRNLRDENSKPKRKRNRNRKPKSKSWNSKSNWNSSAHDFSALSHSLNQSQPNQLRLIQQCRRNKQIKPALMLRTLNGVRNAIQSCIKTTMKGKAKCHI